MQKVLAACDVSTRTFRDGIEVETEAITYAITGSGVRLIMQTGDDVRTAREGKDLVYRFYGSLGSIEFWGWEDRYWLRVDQGRTVPAVTNTSPLISTAHQVYLEMLAEMVQKREPQYELAELSLRALEICEAAYVSHRHRCAVELPLSGFRPPSGPAPSGPAPSGLALSGLALPLVSVRAPAEEWDPGAPYRGSSGRNGRLL